MSQRFLLPVALILMISTISATLWFASESEGQIPRRKSRATVVKKAKAADHVREAYGNLVQLLKDKKYKDVAGRLFNPDVDADHGHSHGDHHDHGHGEEGHGHTHDEVVDIEKMLKSSPDEASRMALVLALFDDSEIHTSADGNAAVMLVTSPKDLKKYQPEKTANGTKLAAEGLGNDLKKAIQSGLELLEEGDLEEFVDRLLPESETKRLQKNNGKKKLVKQLTDYPMLVQFMKADLQKLSKLTPKLEEDDSVAVFQLPGDPNLGDALRQSSRVFAKMPNPPTRTIKFELQHGHWRFFDGGKKINSEIERQEYGLPSSGKLQLKWRLTNSGWKIERMPFFKLQ